MSLWTAAGIALLMMYLGILLAKTGLALRYARSRMGRGDSVVAGQAEEDRTITVLQPILSGDPLLEETLRFNLERTSRDVRFLWLIDESDTEAWEIFQKLTGLFSERLEVLWCEPVPPGLNPKSFKLGLGLERVTTPYVAVLDDDTRLGEESLAEAFRALEGAELYTGLPVYLPAANRWSSLVAHFVNNSSILAYLPVLTRIDPFTLNGMFYVMRRATLQGMGGFGAIEAQLCDDYALARLVRSRGGRIAQGIRAVEIRTTIRDGRHYVSVMHRWFLFAQRQVFDQPAGLRVWLMLLLALPPGLLWAGGMLGATAPAGWGTIALVLLVRHGALRGVQRAILTNPPPFRFLPSLAVELLQPVHMLHAALSRRIRWRSRLIRVEPGGEFAYLEPLP